MDGVIVDSEPVHYEADRRTMAERAYDRCYYPDGVSRQFAAARAGGSRVELLRTISLPAQVIHGVDDPLLPIAGGEDTAANIPGAEFHPVPGMGHETTAPLAPILAELIGGFALGVPD